MRRDRLHIRRRQHSKAAWVAGHAAGLALAVAVMLVPAPGHAGFLDNVRDKVRAVGNSARDNIDRKVEERKDRARERAEQARQEYERRKERAAQAAREQAERIRQGAERIGQASRERASRTTEDLQRRLGEVSDSMGRRGNQVADTIGRQAGDASRSLATTARDRVSSTRTIADRVRSLVPRSASDAYISARSIFGDKVDSGTARGWVERRVNTTRDRLGTAAAGSVREAYRAGGESFSRALSKVQGLHGENGVRAVEDAIVRYGRGAGVGMAKAMGSGKLAIGQGAGGQLMARAAPLIERSQAAARDPLTRERMVQAAVVASAVAYYGYRHRDDLVYIGARKALENTVVTVHGQKLPLDDVVTGTVIDRFPFLAGTRLAEDPAAILAYGVVAVGREDLMTRMEIVPDGHGGRTTVGTALGRGNIPASEAAETLLLTGSMEGVLISAADEGHLGRSAMLFAATQSELDRRYGN